MEATKKLVIVKGKGTKNEQRIKTNIDMFWSSALGRWVTIPENKRPAKPLFNSQY